ncbi:hypothetical protein BDA99DRAFT_139080 [Phascolomyces articulosus]|uniref:Uncharacterized protein n=1 Tax=Phascolomyces articulosus TaxID=60185 RepID=A0AAD5PBK2_9FUNG|nr:hypothetical protein BDA99DRAFT_139080 [Phascolomyces articulosus]
MIKLYLCTYRYRETERKLQKANTEFTTIQERLAQCQDEKKFFEKKFNKLRDKLQSVQKSKSSRSNHIARMYNEAGPSSSNVLGSNKGSSSRIYTTNAQADKSSNIHRSSSVDSDDSTSDELSVGPQTVPKKRARTGSSNRNHSGHGPYTTFSFNRSTTQTDQRKDTNGVPPRNQEPKEIKCPQSEIDDLELSDTNDYNENESSLVVLQSRVINGDSDSDTDDGGQASFDEGFSISTNRSRRHHHAQFRSPSPPVIGKSTFKYIPLGY